MGTNRFHSKVAGQGGTASDEFLTKSQIDSLIADAKNLANATGSITTAQVSDFTSAVQTIVNGVIDGAPGALDTLNELAAALGDDPNFATTVTNQIAGLDTRLDTVEANQGAADTNNYKTTIGDGALSSYTVTHNLNSVDLLVQVKDISTGQYEFPVITTTGANTLTVDFGATVPTSASKRVLIREI